MLGCGVVRYNRDVQEDELQLFLTLPENPCCEEDLLMVMESPRCTWRSWALAHEEDFPDLKGRDSQERLRNVLLWAEVDVFSRECGHARNQRVKFAKSQTHAMSYEDLCVGSNMNQDACWNLGLYAHVKAA